MWWCKRTHRNVPTRPPLLAAAGPAATLGASEFASVKMGTITRSTSWLGGHFK